MKIVNVHEAQTQLSQLIEAVEAGDEILIARAGKPVAQLTPLAKRRAIKLGVLNGKIPKRLLEEIEKPLSGKQIRELFGA
jgi:prevent-host-death family protein